MGTNKDWADIAAKELRGKPLDDLTWNTLEGIAVKPLYTADDTADLPHMGGVPGAAPYTRGVKATMYAGRPLDDPPIRWFFHSRGIQHILPRSPCWWPAGRFRRL